MTEPVAQKLDNLTPLYDAAETAARIKQLQRMRRENAFRLRRLRGVPRADISDDEFTMVLRSAFAVMGHVWYTWLQSPSAQLPPTDDEWAAGRKAMVETPIIGLGSAWYMLRLRQTPYMLVESHCSHEIQGMLALENRFENRLDNGQQWLTGDERTCYDLAMPHSVRRPHGDRPRAHSFAPGVTEAVWSIFDYMARMLDEHHTATGRTVTREEYDAMARFTRRAMITGAFRSRKDNLDDAHHDVFAYSAFDYAFSPNGVLTSIERNPINPVVLDALRLNPTMKAVFDDQSQTQPATGCPFALARIKTAPASEDAPRNPNNFVSYVVGRTLDAIGRSIFEPNPAVRREYMTVVLDDDSPRPMRRSELQALMQPVNAATDESRLG